MKFLSSFFIVVCVFVVSATLADDFKVEDYGLLPDIKSVSISPDGKHYAFIKETAKGTVFVIVDIAQNKMVGGANAGDLKARSIYFATNEHVILSASRKMSSFRVRGNWEQNSSIVYNLKTKKMTLLSKRVKDLYLAQGGLGRIVGVNIDKQEVYMPAYVGSNEPTNSLFKVDLNTLSARRLARGNGHVIDWFVDKDGNILAREQYNERKQLHEVYSQIDGKWKNIYSKQTDIPQISIVAVSENSNALIFESTNENYDAIYSMALQDGTISEPLYERENTDIDSILRSKAHRKITGILYSGLLPNYEYLDDNLQNNIAAIQDVFPSSAVYPLSMTADRRIIILKISGNEAASNYIIFNTETRKLQIIGSGYPQVSVNEIAKVKPIKYRARDGLPITAILTSPVGVEKPKNEALIVMPHGGPESYDGISFDWWAQFLARKGYLVLQPNFRGSSGFGTEFTQAGYGKWGKEMQDDVSDGVSAMVKAGYANPEKVCIMGASYGGYSALAGGAFTPDLYKCVVSVAGVADLPLMLRQEARDYGKNHWVVSYWNKIIGNSKSEREKLKHISPVNSAANFKAPLLMLHGRDDTVVPIVQSQRMLKAMKRAGKEAELITLKGEDHWLSGSETRLELLKKISDFLDKHNPIEAE